MMKEVDLWEGAGREPNLIKGCVAPARQNCRVDTTVVSHACDTGSSYKISNVLSPLVPTSVGIPAVREREVLTSALRRAQERSSERFVKGPIPIRLIAAAGKLPGRALLVLLAIRHRIDLTGKPAVSLPSSTLADFGFDKHVKSRALCDLEQAGLIRVSRVKGRAAIVTLVHPAGKDRRDRQRDRQRTRARLAKRFCQKADPYDLR